MEALTNIEKIVFDALNKAAEAKEPCPRNEDLQQLTGFGSLAGVVGLIKRLEEKGYIKVERWQRSRQVEIVASGLMTARPINKTPHWRERPVALPRPALTTLSVIHPEIVSDIQGWASGRGVALDHALADLVYVGWCVERSR